MPGEWIDELGVLLLHFPKDPQVAMDLFRAPENDMETRKLAELLMNSELPAYPAEQQPQPLTTLSEGGAVEPVDPADEEMFDGPA